MQISVVINQLRGEQIPDVWTWLNFRLLKWVKCEKGLYKMVAIKWLKTKFKYNPGLSIIKNGYNQKEENKILTLRSSTRRVRLSRKAVVQFPSLT